MKVICPISGVPFRTYDSLPLDIAVNHPIFSVPYESLIMLLDKIREQELQEIENISELLAQKQELLSPVSLKDLSKMAVEAIHEKNWRNPAFKLYQTKHLVMLAFMQRADLLRFETGYVARPNPQIIEAYFWRAIEMLIWVNCIANPKTQELLPHYAINAATESMDNFAEYLETLENVKNHIGQRYRSISEEKQLEAMEKAIAILARRKSILRKELSDSSNHIAAKWALAMARCPKDVYPFWYGILSSSSSKITFEGVKINDKWELVTPGDLRELRDFLEDNLIGPQGEHKEYHRDDAEYYFEARQAVLAIVRRHIAILEQGTTSYKMVNVALGDDILSASDDALEKKALENGYDPKPNFTEFVGKNKIEYIKALAAWRHNTKIKLLDKLNMTTPKTEEQKKESKTYEIL